MDYETLDRSAVGAIRAGVADGAPKDEVLTTLEREHVVIEARLEQRQSADPDADRARLAEIEGHVERVKAAR
jgi:hypothetical protein